MSSNQHVLSTLSVFDWHRLLPLTLKLENCCLLKQWQQGKKKTLLAQMQHVQIYSLCSNPLVVSSFYFVTSLSLLRLRVEQACRTHRFCATFWGGTERRDAKVGSLPHGCVYCRETSVYPPAETALGALEPDPARTLICRTLALFSASPPPGLSVGKEKHSLSMRFGNRFKLRRPRQVDFDPRFVWLWDNLLQQGSADPCVRACGQRNSGSGWMVLH